MKANTIDEVIVYLDEIINDARQKFSRRGYFAALYRRVTAAVKIRIAQKQFEDGARIEAFDVTYFLSPIIPQASDG